MIFAIFFAFIFFLKNKVFSYILKNPIYKFLSFFTKSQFITGLINNKKLLTALYAIQRKTLYAVNNIVIKKERAEKINARKT